MRDGREKRERGPGSSVLGLRRGLVPCFCKAKSPASPPEKEEDDDDLAGFSNLADAANKAVAYSSIQEL